MSAVEQNQEAAIRRRDQEIAKLSAQVETMREELNKVEAKWKRWYAESIEEVRAKLLECI